MRLFFAVGLNEPVKDAICAAMDRMRTCCESGNFTLRDHLHLTLVFLGEVPPQRLSAAKEAMGAAEAKSFSIQVGGIGCFHQSGGDLYWAGVERSAPLCGLYSSLCRELRKRGFEVDSRFYRPHLTLVRRAVLKGNCDRGLLSVPVFQMGVDHFSLMLSERCGGRLIYSELASRSLEA